MTVEEAHELGKEGSLGNLIAGRMFKPMIGDEEDDSAIERFRNEGTSAKLEGSIAKIRAAIADRGSIC